ncbi:hypothetical protein Tco_1468262 [Tanacetum coccineum]
MLVIFHHLRTSLQVSKAILQRTKMCSSVSMSSSHKGHLMECNSMPLASSASEMAALAVKASVALNSKASSSSKSSKGYSQQKRSNSYKKKSKISPFVVMETSKINVIIDEEAADRLMLDQKQQQQLSSSSLGVSSRSGSIRKMQRYSSRKARLAVRSFRLRLSTIYEAESVPFS